MAQPPDPGPIDKSVLVEQEHHKSEAIFTGRVCNFLVFSVPVWMQQLPFS